MYLQLQQWWGQLPGVHRPKPVLSCLLATRYWNVPKAAAGVGRALGGEGQRLKCALCSSRAWFET